MKKETSENLNIILQNLYKLIDASQKEDYLKHLGDICYRLYLSILEEDKDSNYTNASSAAFELYLWAGLKEDSNDKQFVKDYHHGIKEDFPEIFDV